MTITRRATLKLISAPLALQLAQPAAAQQDYPARPVRIIVGFPEGGPVDIAARLVSPWLSEKIGQPIIVENHPGESGNIATGEVIRAAPDGYTLLLCGPVNTINTTLFPDLKFDFGRDVAPVAGISHVPLIVETNPATGLRTVPEFLSFARANPGALKVAYAGTGTPQHIGIELFKHMAGIDLTLVPYLGSTPALADLLDRKVDMMFDPAPSSMPHVQAGRLVPLAVTGPGRLDSLPGIPTMGEFVTGYEAGSWFGLVAPRDTPANVVARLNSEITAAVSDPAIQARLAALGASAMPKSPADFGALIKAETARYAEVIKASGIKSQ